MNSMTRNHYIYQNELFDLILRISDPLCLAGNNEIGDVISQKIEQVITCMRPFDAQEEQDQIVQVD